MITKDFPMSFEEQLRRNCPALFRMNEADDLNIPEPEGQADQVPADQSPAEDAPDSSIGGDDARKQDLLKQITDHLNQMTAHDLDHVLQLVSHVNDNKPT